MRRERDRVMRLCAMNANRHATVLSFFKSSRGTKAKHSVFSECFLFSDRLLTSRTRQLGV